MANEKIVQENDHEITEYEIQKPWYEKLIDRIKRPALPGETISKHKITNIDMRASMSFREFRAALMKSVGNIFQSLSNLGSQSKEESLNKYAQKYTATIQQEIIKSTDETTQTKPTIRIPEPVYIKHATTVPVVENITVDRTVIEQINKTPIQPGFTSNEPHTDTDKQPKGYPESSVKTETLITGGLEHASVPKPTNSTKETGKADNEKHDLEL